MPKYNEGLSAFKAVTLEGSYDACDEDSVLTKSGSLRLIGGVETPPINLESMCYEEERSR